MSDEGRPRTVRDILLEMKDASETAVSLSYAALMFSDEEIAEEVLELENRLDELRYELSVRTILAGRTLEDARELAAVLEIGSAADEISDAVGDLAKLVKRGYPLHPSLLEAFWESDEVQGIVKVVDGSPLAGMRISDLRDPSALAGCDLLGIKRGGRWIFNPPEDGSLRPGDVLLLEGTREGLMAVKGLSGRSGPVQTVPPQRGAGEAARLVELIKALKSLSELMVYLAYAAILLNNQGMAYEISKLEDEVDDLHEIFQGEVLSSLVGRAEIREIIGLLRAGSSAERIGDAANRMASVVERGIPTHPVLADVVERSGETIVRLEIPEGSPAADRPIGELNLEESTGMEVLAIKRGIRWIYDPKDSVRLRAGDVVLLLGSPYGERAAEEVLGIGRRGGRSD